MPAGESPVQLRYSKAEGRHAKDTACNGGVFVLLILYAFCKYLLMTLPDL